MRIALGADQGNVRRMIVREALVPVGAGVATGLVAALWLTRGLASLLYETSPHDPLALTVVVGVLIAVATLAAFFPARRATLLDPVTTLRAE